jgi:hypothetical protein
VTRECLLWVISGHTGKVRGEYLSAGRGLGQQGTIYGSAVRESVADHSLCPGACRTLEHFIGDVAPEEIFCLVECDGDAHDVAAPLLPCSTQADLASIDNEIFGARVCFTPGSGDRLALLECRLGAYCERV